MTDASVPPPAQWIDLARCDDPRDVVHQVVACLAQGGVVGLATETVYVLASSTLHGEGLVRLRSLGRAPDMKPLPLLIKGPEEAIDWAPGMSQAGRRLTARLWPGPLTLTFGTPLATGLFQQLPARVRDLVAPGGELSLCSPHDPFLRAVVELMPAPVAVGRVTGADDPPATTAEPLRLIPGLDMVVDSGPTHCGQVGTQVQIDHEGWRVVGPGVIDSQTLTRMSGHIILFVCTGNTCRSPMAEAICKLMIAQRLGCTADQLEAKGYVVLSAGVAAMGGAPAASHAIEVLRSLGGSLESHRSRRVTPELVRQADCIFAMTLDHLDALLDAVPEAQAHTLLLDPHGGDVPDPIGSDHQVYRQTARMIEEMLEERLRQMGL